MYAFIHIPKTGGTTINFILRGSFGWHHCDIESIESRFQEVSQSDIDLIQQFYPKIYSIAGHRVVPYSNLEELKESIQYYTFFRDPVKRCASFFQFRQERTKETLSFMDWIKYKYVNDGQTLKIAGERDLELAKEMIVEKDIFTGLTEFFDESLKLLHHLYIPELNITYARKNTAVDNRIKNELITNPETREMILEANQLDLKLFEWVKEKRLPLYRKKMEMKIIANQERLTYDTRRGINLFVNRLYRNIIYKPLLFLYRKKYLYSTFNDSFGKS